MYAAQSLGSLLGLQGSLSLHREWMKQEIFGLSGNLRFDKHRDDTHLELGAAVDLDFAGEGVPLGILAEYVLLLGRRDIDQDHDTAASSFGAGFYYTGRPNLELGFAGVVSLNTLRRPGRSPTGRRSCRATPSCGTRS
jgi:hypothetical protein